MQYQYFDIHSHLNFPDYDKDREEVITRMNAQEIGTIGIGTDIESSRAVVELASNHNNVYAAIGLHPVDDSAATLANGLMFDIEAFKILAKHPKVVSVGECGLDYGRESVISPEKKAEQVSVFETQIAFAVECDKSIMIHARNSHNDILDILESKKREYGDVLRGNAHFFTGTVEQAKRYLDLNFSLSFTGVITFARDYDDVVKFAPIDMIMAETDAPFVAPVPYRRSRNEPTYVVEVVKKLAEIRGEEVDFVRAQTVKNALKRYGIASLDL